LWSCSYGSWMYDYLCYQCISPLKLWVRTPFMVRCTRPKLLSPVCIYSLFHVLFSLFGRLFYFFRFYCCMNLKLNMKEINKILAKAHLKCILFLKWCIFTETCLYEAVGNLRHAFTSPSCSLREKSSLPVFCKCGEPCIYHGSYELTY